MQLTGTSWSVDCAILQVETHSKLCHPPGVLRASPVPAMMCPHHPILGAPPPPTRRRWRRCASGRALPGPRLPLQHGRRVPPHSGRLRWRLAASIHGVRMARIYFPSRGAAHRNCAARRARAALKALGGLSLEATSMQSASHASLACFWRRLWRPSAIAARYCALASAPIGAHPASPLAPFFPCSGFACQRSTGLLAALQAPLTLDAVGWPARPIPRGPSSLEQVNLATFNFAGTRWVARAQCVQQRGTSSMPRAARRRLDGPPHAVFDGASRAFTAPRMPSSTARPNRHDRLAFECAWAGARSARWTARARRVQKREVSSMPRPMRRRPEGSSHAAPGGTSCAFSGLRVPTSMARPGRRGRPALPYLARRVVPPACHGHSWARLVDPATLRAPRSIGRRVPRRHSSPVAWRVPCGPAPAAAFSPSTRRIVLPACVVSSIVSLAAPPPCGTASLLVWSGTMVDRSPRVFLALASRDVLAPRRSAGVFLLPPSLAERELLVDRWRELIGRRGVGVHLHLLPRVHAQAPRLLLTLTSARLHSPCLSPMWSRSHRARCSRSCPQIRSSSETSCNGGSSIRRLHADGGAIRTLPPLDDTLRVSHVHTGTGAHGRFRRSSMCWGGSGHGVSVTLAAQSQPDRTSARTGASGAVARRIPDDVRSARRGTLRPSHAGAEATGRVALTRNQNEE